MANSSFIILTTYGPHLENPTDLRGILHEAYRMGIDSIDYTNYQVYLFGHLPNKKTGRYNFIRTRGANKEQKLEEAKQYFLENSIQSDYILRIDDDDIINPNAFKEIDAKQYDVYYDEFHCFFDISSGKASRQKRHWIPNTCVMRYELAFTKLYLNNALLFNFEHSVWLLYLQSIRLNIGLSDDKTAPLYFRVLSPSSITSLHDENKSHTQYLSHFGDWNYAIPADFRKSINNLLRLLQNQQNLLTSKTNK